MLPEIFGYDPLLLAQLKPRRRRTVSLLAEAWIISSAALAASVGYAIWLVEHSLWVSLLCALAMGLVVINLLRLVVAGSGAAPHLSMEHVSEYRPALGPAFVLSMLAVLLAQPAQLPLWQAELAAPVAEHREQLLAQQEQLAHTLGHPVQRAFRRELTESEFLAWRVRAIWKDPQRAFVLSALYWFLVLLPTLAGRFIALSALREYERARWVAARAQIQAEGEAAAARVHSELAPYASYRAPSFSSLAAPFDKHVPFLRGGFERPATGRSAPSGARAEKRAKP
jgi:hypothetical protein